MKPSFAQRKAHAEHWCRNPKKIWGSAYRWFFLSNQSYPLYLLILIATDIFRWLSQPSFPWLFWTILSFWLFWGPRTTLPRTRRSQKRLSGMFWRWIWRKQKSTKTWFVMKKSWRRRLWGWQPCLGTAFFIGVKKSWRGSKTSQKKSNTNKCKTKYRLLQIDTPLNLTSEESRWILCCRTFPQRCGAVYPRFCHLFFGKNNFRKGEGEWPLIPELFFGEKHFRKGQGTPHEEKFRNMI